MSEGIADSLNKHHLSSEVSKGYRRKKKNTGKLIQNVTRLINKQINGLALIFHAVCAGNKQIHIK